MQDRRPVHNRHPQVKQDEVGFLVGDCAEQCPAIGERRDRRESGAIEDGLEQLDVGRLIVGDVDPTVAHRVHRLIG